MSAADFLETFFRERFHKVILLVGMTGNGKSSLGNLIAGKKVFETNDEMAGCTKDHNVYTSNELSVTIIDTVGMADPDEMAGEVNLKITEALKASKDGVDMILFCITKDRLTHERYQVFKTLLTVFGDSCRQNLVLVVTKAGRRFICQSVAQNLSERNKYLKSNLNRPGNTSKWFSEMYDACERRVLFVDNPPYEHESEEDCAMRQTSRDEFLGFLRSCSFKKYFPEVSLRFREEERLRSIEVKRIRTVDDVKASGLYQSYAALALTRERFFRY